MIALVAQVFNDGAALKTCIDGQHAGSVAMTGAAAIHLDRELAVGKDLWGSNFNGQIDALEIYNIIN